MAGESTKSKVHQFVQDLRADEAALKEVEEFLQAEAERIRSLQPAGRGVRPRECLNEGCTFDKRVIRDLGRWMRLMREWCERVRLDIVRLEGHAGFSAGDPGDPPREPWGDE